MIGKRIEEYRLHKGYKVAELARIIGIAQGSLSEIKNEHSEPRADTLEKIVRNTDVDAHWLLTGEGSMIRSTQTIEEGDTPLTRLRSVKPGTQALVSDLIDILESDDAIMKTAITENIKAFKISVDRKAKLEKSDVESDFKTRESLGESKHRRDKHRVGGE
ncbi:MAG: helix-turn-helix domain-containing protein [Syntrophorhabdus sp.]|nr:helix-turn-helix domain-containing protein [Syntrophorhabdus sp.]OPY84603.1 MAG: HTH-type transcriptional regulator SinR [Syntrophorhabdus sp. PtaU1.Bin153]